MCFLINGEIKKNRVRKKAVAWRVWPEGKEKPEALYNHNDSLGLANLKKFFKISDVMMAKAEAEIKDKVSIGLLNKMKIKEARMMNKPTI